jgi:hypothetical protein
MSQENNNIIVSLRKMNSPGEEALTLEKIVADANGKNFGKILNYMLEPGEDSLNPAYNVEERDLCEDIRKWKDDAQSEKGSLDIMYVKGNNEYSEAVLISETPGNYDDIILQKQRSAEFGEDLKYDGIDLVARFEPVGGNY